MDVRYNGSYFVVTDSPIEFLIMGRKPSKSATKSSQRDGILVRSEILRADVLGKCVSLRYTTEDRVSSLPLRFEPFSPFTRLFGFPKVRRFNQVMSSAIVPDVPNSSPGDAPNLDDRTAKYRLAWIGNSSTRTRAAVEEALNLNMQDLARAVTEDDKELVEISVAPIIYACDDANSRKDPVQQLFQLYVITILLVGGIAAFVFLATYFYRLFSRI